MEPTPFSDSEFRERHDKLRNAMSGIDMTVIFSRAELYHYTSIGLDGALVLSGENLTHYVRRNHELAEQESRLPTALMGSYRLFKEIGRKREVKTLGLELDLLPYKTVSYIQKALGNPELVDIGGTLRQLRAVKSEKEIEQMRLSCQQTDRSFEVAREVIRPGMTEIELSAEIERQLRRDGHPGWIQVRQFHHNLTNLAYVAAGDSIAILNSKFGPFSGQGISRMHTNGASRRKIREGDPVIIDTTGFHQGYISDITRTFFVGDVDRKLLDLFEVAKAVQERAERILRRGADPREIYVELVGLVTEMGAVENFMGIHSDKVEFIGHGVGLELDEFPIITPKYSETLSTGNIIALEPKFVLDNPRAGVGVEETWLVNDSGGERLSKFPNDLFV